MAAKNWTTTFINALGETSNVKAACDLARISQAAVYKKRREDADFARAWYAALAEGYDNLEMDLLARLTDATMRQLAMGANRAALGSEIIQFASAVPLAANRWRLSGLWRGRGGTESAIIGHAAGERFVLLDGTGTALDPNAVGETPGALIAAIGLADSTTATSPIALRGIGGRPLAPVHAKVRRDAIGTVELGWTRRSRGGWTWTDGVDLPLNEQSEFYTVSFGTSAAVAANWECQAPNFAVSSAEYASLLALMPTGIFAVRQRGDRGVSEPLYFPQP